MDWSTISEYASANAVYIGAIAVIVCLGLYYMKDSFLESPKKKKSSKKTIVADDDSLSEEVDELSNSIEEKQKSA
jgi:putative Mn2+ efflux pump MntP